MSQKSQSFMYRPKGGIWEGTSKKSTAQQYFLHSLCCCLINTKLKMSDLSKLKMNVQQLNNFNIHCAVVQ